MFYFTCSPFHSPDYQRSCLPPSSFSFLKNLNDAPCCIGRIASSEARQVGSSTDIPALDILANPATILGDVTEAQAISFQIAMGWTDAQTEEALIERYTQRKALGVPTIFNALFRDEPAGNCFMPLPFACSCISSTCPVLLCPALSGPSLSLHIHMHYPYTLEQGCSLAWRPWITHWTA